MPLLTRFRPLIGSLTLDTTALIAFPNLLAECSSVWLSNLAQPFPTLRSSVNMLGRDSSVPGNCLPDILRRFDNLRSATQSPDST